MDETANTTAPDAPPDGQDEARFWKLYGGTRLMALVGPLTKSDEEMLPRITRGLVAALGLDPAAAAREALRVVYACRD